MGLDFAAVFKKPINFEGHTNNEFTPFSRALSNFFYANYYGADSTFEELEDLLKINLKFLIEPNLFDYRIDEMQMEFAVGSEKEKLVEKQKELDQNSHKAWKDINEYLTKLVDTIKTISESNKLAELTPDRKEWHKYIQSGEFKDDLTRLKELLQEAGKNENESFSFEIY